MKKLLLIIFVVVFSVTTQAQDNIDTQKTSLEITENAGVFNKKEYYPIKTINGAKFEVMIITNVVSDKKTGYLRLETNKYSSYGTSSYVGLIELDEIKDLKKTLEYIVNNILGTSPLIYTECSYTTRNKVYFSVFYNNTTNKWNSIIYSEKGISNSSKEINIVNITKIVDILSEAEDLIIKYTN